MILLIMKMESMEFTSVGYLALAVMDDVYLWVKGW